VESVVSCIDTVRVDILVKENVGPEGIREVWAVSSYDEVIFGASDVDKVVCFEKKCLGNISIKGSGSDKYFRPRVHIFIDISVWSSAGHSYMGCWEVVINQLACIKLLLLGGYFGRTFDSVGPLFTEVWIENCKAMHLDTNET